MSTSREDEKRGRREDAWREHKVSRLGWVMHREDVLFVIRTSEGRSRQNKNQ